MIRKLVFVAMETLPPPACIANISQYLLPDLSDDGRFYKLDIDLRQMLTISIQTFENVYARLTSVLYNRSGFHVSDRSSISKDGYVVKTVSTFNRNAEESTASIRIVFVIEIPLIDGDHYRIRSTKTRP